MKTLRPACRPPPGPTEAELSLKCRPLPHGCGVSGESSGGSLPLCVCAGALLPHGLWGRCCQGIAPRAARAVGPQMPRALQVAQSSPSKSAGPCRWCMPLPVLCIPCSGGGMSYAGRGPLGPGRAPFSKWPLLLARVGCAALNALMEGPGPPVDLRAWLREGSGEDLTARGPSQSKSRMPHPCPGEVAGWDQVEGEGTGPWWHAVASPLFPAAKLPSRRLPGHIPP